MKKICLLLFLMLLPVIVMAEAEVGDLTSEEVANLKKDIAAGVRWRERFAHNLIWLTKGKEILFLVPYLESDSDPQMRAVIAEGLGKYGDPSIAVPALLKAREDSSWSVRSSVAKSLLQRGKENEAATVYIRLIKEKVMYWGMYDEIKRMRDEKVKNSIKEEVLKIINDTNASIVKQAYAISFLVYIYYEPLAPKYKEIIIKALKYVEGSSVEINDIGIMSDVVGAILPDHEIKREDYLEIATLAIKSKHKYIKQAGDSRFKLLENLK